MTALEAYTRIAPVDDTAPNPLIALEQRILVPILPQLSGRTVVDVGAGTGRWLRYAQADGARSLAVDLCPAMLATAPRPCVVANAAAIPLRDNAAQVVFCTFTLGYSPACFSELVRITRPGGTVIVTDIHPDAIARGWSRAFRVGTDVIEPAHQPYSLSSLTHTSLVQTHFEEPHLGEPERDIFERAGKLASFNAASAHPAIFVALWTKK